MALGSKKSGAANKAADTIRRLDGLRKDATKPVAFRMDPRDIEKLEIHARENGLKLAQLVKSWVLQRMKQEGLK